LPGILAWVVRGCLECYLEGLAQPQEVADVTQEYRSEMDVLGGFIEECCVVNPNISANATHLYTEYVKWCERNGEHAETQRRFGMRLRERGFKKETSGTVTWYGIGARFDGPDPQKGPDGGPSEDKVRDGESRIPKPNPEKFRNGSGPYGPFSGLNGLREPREEVMPRKGPQGPKGPETVSGDKRHPQGNPESQQGSLRSAKEGKASAEHDEPFPSLASGATAPRSAAAIVREENDVVISEDTVTCIHGYPSGKDCYLCDPNHSSRKH
jgi:hypothetical protein